MNKVYSDKRGESMAIQEYLAYVGQLLLLTLGVIVSCGLMAWLAQRIFAYFVGAGSIGVVYASSVIGTPIHELGHAIMCLLFAHKITDIKLHSLTDTLESEIGTQIEDYELTVHYVCPECKSGTRRR